ncbi:hypothetical protein [Streptomyces sp. NPDC097619]|uniref:hypothetical protein n=1 Tax=Streptomyces sp. NPDC097619 TaxID=3157228 RepID=UPI0033275F14
MSQVTVYRPLFPSRAAAVLRGRIGAGFFPAPLRYRLYLSEGCPLSDRLLAAHTRLGLADRVPVTLLPADPERSPLAYEALRRAYEATGHHYAGELTVPALADVWTGRIVSNHAPEILSDLTGALTR